MCAVVDLLQDRDEGLALDSRVAKAQILVCQCNRDIAYGVVGGINETNHSHHEDRHQHKHDQS
jgi:hypothetical protein